MLNYVKDPIFFGWFLGSQSFVPWSHPKCGEFCYSPSTWTCFWVKTIHFQYTSRNPQKKTNPKNSNVPSRTVLWISMDDVSSRIFCPGRPGTGLQGSPGIAPASVDHPHRWHHPAWLGQIPPTDPRASEKWSNYLEIIWNYGQSWEIYEFLFCEIVFNSWTSHDKPIENKKVSHRMVPPSYKLVYKPH